MVSIPITEAFTQLESTQNQLISVLSAFHDACTQLYKTAVKIQSSHEIYKALDDRLIQMNNQLDLLSVGEEKFAQSLAFLRRTRNISQTLVPINRLPAEILATVFELTVSGHKFASSIERGAQINPMATIPSVCQSWRQLALRTPYLWSYIDLSGAMHTASLNRAVLWAERSRQAPVHLRLEKYRFFETQDLAPELKNISTRAASFTFTSYSDEIYVRDLFNQYNSSGRSDTLKTIDIGPGQWPNILSSHFDWSAFVPNTLTTLKLCTTSENITPTMDELMLLLSRTPNLRALILRDVRVQGSVPGASYPEAHLPHLEYLESYPHRLTRPNYMGVTKCLMQSIVPGSKDLEVWLEMGEANDEDHDSAMRKFCGRSRVTRLHTGYFKPDDHLPFTQYLDCLPELQALSLDFDGEPTNDILDALIVPGEGEEFSARCPKLQTLRISEACIIPQSQVQLKRIVEAHELSSLILGDRAYFVDESGDHCDDAEIMEWLREKVREVEVDQSITWFSLGA
ncbi:F-box-like protein [Ceratobasidium sp. AG-Ba]|nr:F-box-like protein [Ceratobasidium sp. AG-Ba]